MGVDQNGLEHFLSSYHALLRAQRRALVLKVPTPVQILMRGTTRTPARKTLFQMAAKLVRSKVSVQRLVLGRTETAEWVDFVGVIKDGPFVAIEAKQSTTPRFRMSRLPEHQADFLEEAEAMGGVAALYLRLAGEDFFIPWSHVKEMPRTLSGAVLAPYMIPPQTGWLDLHWFSHWRNGAPHDLAPRPHTPADRRPRAEHLSRGALRWKGSR